LATEDISEKAENFFKKKFACFKKS
jgi:hypothetical protein